MATQTNIMSDVGTLLKMPTKITNELISKACLCIGSAISEAKKSGAAQVTVNIGIGALSIHLQDMQCKFIPTKELKNTIKNALDTQTDPLELVLEKAFVDKLLAICEEVL